MPATSRLPSLGLAWIAVSLAACPMTDTVRPELTVTVVDDKGRPLRGARVTLLSISYPHNTDGGSEEATTDADGRVAWHQETKIVTGCLCLPHGVPARGFKLCADAPGYEPVARDHDGEEELRIELEPATGPQRKCQTGARAKDFSFGSASASAPPTPSASASRP
jgi:hypothetical protein